MSVDKQPNPDASQNPEPKPAPTPEPELPGHAGRAAPNPAPRIESASADPTEDLPTAADYERLRKRLKFVKLQSRVAEESSRRDELIQNFPTLDILSDRDRSRKRTLRDRLIDEVKSELRKLGMPVPDNEMDVEAFLRDFVDDHWFGALSHCQFDSEHFPRSTLDAIIKALFERRNSIRNLRGEIFETSKGDRLWRWRRVTPRNGQTDPPAYAKFDFIYSRRAGELRAEKKQHKVQRLTSWFQPFLTAAASLFMVLMLLLGMVQLLLALSYGFHLDEPFIRLAERSIGIVTSGIDLIAPGQTPSALTPDSGALAPTLHPDGDHAASTDGSLLAHSAVSDQSTHSLPDGAAGAPAHAGRRGHSGSHEAMKRALTALELILLAPLPYLLILGLSRYIRALAFQESADEYRKELLDFKAFEVALFIAIIAAATVGRALEHDDSRGLTYQFSISAALVIAVLSAYFLIIEWRSDVAEKEKREAMEHAAREAEKKRRQSAPVDS